MTSRNKPLSRQSEIVVQNLNAEVLIYDLKKSKALCLNKTSALIWQLCDGNHSISEIATAIAQKLKTNVDEDLILLALDQLKREDLLNNTTEADFIPAGFSRRDAIKKVGLATMIALPVISSLAAPTAAMAQSSAASTCLVTGNFCSCSLPGPNVTTGTPCRTIINPTTLATGVPTGCGTDLTCDCQVTASSTDGVCIGVTP